MASLELQDVVKRFGAVEVIHGVDLKIEDGEFVVFVGPSGCGKSTLLRMIAGLEAIIGGRRLYRRPAGQRRRRRQARPRHGVPVLRALPAYDGAQEPLLRPGDDGRTASRKSSSGSPRPPKSCRSTRLLDRRPGQLSGGQRQRVAIGRAIVREPKIFLFDEPLSNLDAELRVQMRVEINKLHRRLGATMIFVTHDQVEAMTLADRIVVLRAGVIEQVGTPLELYNHPANLFVAGFIGSPRMNFLAAQMVGAGGDGETEHPGQVRPRPCFSSRARRRPRASTTRSRSASGRST